MLEIKAAPYLTISFSALLRATKVSGWEGRIVHFPILASNLTLEVINECTGFLWQPFGKCFPHQFSQ